MALIFDLAAKQITIPQADLTLVSGTLYDHDTEAFKLEVGLAQATETGMPFDDVFSHNTEVTIAGTTFARSIEIINGWSVEYEDGQYTVRLVGSNNNLFDVGNGILVQNQVQIISQNSAGLINAASAAAVFAHVGLDGETFDEHNKVVRASTAGKLLRPEPGKTQHFDKSGNNVVIDSTNNDETGERLNVVTTP